MDKKLSKQTNIQILSEPTGRIFRHSGKKNRDIPADR